MQLFKRTGSCFQAVAQQRFADEHYESHLEEWIYHNPQLIADDLMMIGRQVVTDGLKRMDLLALNSRGHTVIIELKRAENPRDLVGQINEYITAVGKWSERELEKRIGRQPRTLEKAFRERFKSEPPDEFNRHREAVVVVEDIDPDTLAAFRRQGIRVITFSYLKSAEEEYLLVNELNLASEIARTGRPKSPPRANPEEVLNRRKVKERSEFAPKAPPPGFWFVNVGEGPHRSWDDCVKYGFLSAGQGKRFSDAMKKLEVGDKVFAFMNRLGYVGYGKITQEAVMAREFKVGDRYLFKVPLTQAGIRENGDNAELSEWSVGVKWSRTYP